MSTVLDVAVCLLLVGAAVATLAAAPHADAPDRHDADPTVSTVATVTTTVHAGDDRRAHDTMAGHLATATVTDARLDDARLVETGYPTEVANETDSLTGDRAYVTARWEPYPDAPLAGTVAAGEEPPSSADVAARTLIVDSGLDVPEDVDAFDEVARAIADAYVTRLFPPERTYASLVDPRTADRTGGRYRSAAGALEVDVGPSVAERDVRSANDELSAALAARLEADLRDRYATPGAAVSNATVDDVEIVVRRWEP